MRDTIKNLDYFEQFIREDEKRIKKFETKLLKGEVKNDRILAAKMKVHDLKLGILIAKYSKGEKIENLVDQCKELIQTFSDVWVPEFYIKNLWIVSLGILLNLEEEYLSIIRNLVRKSKLNDWLINYLLDYKEEKSNEEYGILQFPDTYKNLYDLIISSSGRNEKMKKYLEIDWYKGHSECGFHDSHKSKQNLYYGYWSFESGAVAKILKIEDDNLKGVVYYPYDLVHFK